VYFLTLAHTVKIEAKKMGLSKIKNRFLLNDAYLRGREFVGGFPNECVIELTNNCDLQCIFCPHQHMKREKGYIELRLFKKIIDEISDSCELVDLDMFGESFLHPQVFEMVKYCKSKGLTTIVHTNMNSVDKAMSEKIISSGLDMIVISIDGSTPETYESIRRGANFEKVMTNTNALLGSGNPKPHVTVQMIYMTKNLGEVNGFYDLWRGKKVDSVRIRPYENIHRQAADLNALGIKKNVDSRPCIHLWRKMYICWDGKVVSCCNDYDNFNILGDAKEDSVRKIWNNGDYLAFRRKHLDGQRCAIPLCKSCSPANIHPALIAGSIFLGPRRLRKYLYLLEKLLIFNKIRLINYF
jgi:MoaA/NifB/PqqE/SkfB family radical SAM enzyme